MKKAWTNLLLAGAATSAIMTAQTASAQIASPNTPGQSGEEPAVEEGEAEDAIVVTGSRIARRGLESAMPIAVIDAETTKAFGYNTTYDALRLNPAVGPGLGNSNSQGEAFDAGVSNINLRNLGVNRTLVLVDGKRWVSSGARSSAVDLSTIPEAMIERSEIVTGGAAAIYGADAVTGVVNIILKKNVEGVHLSATNGISQQGDARETYLSASTGFKFADDRGSFVIGGNYTDTTPVRYTDRYTDRAGYVANPANTGPRDGIPDNILEENLRFFQRSSVPTFLHNNQWYQLRDGALNPVAYDRTYVTGALGNGSGGPGGIGFSNHFLRNEAQNVSVYARAGYELTPDLLWSVSASFARTSTKGATVFPEVRDDSRPTNWWGGTTGEVATLTNPFLPDALRQFMLVNGLTAIPLSRDYLNLPQPIERHERNNFTIGTDLEGRLSERFKWSAFFRYGQVVDDVTTTYMPRNTRWLAARDSIADPVTGQPVCANAAARTAGCVPFDFFTTAPPSQAFLDYAFATRHEWRKNALYTAGGNVSGSLFSLPYGDASVALGAEWRRETLSTRDDPDTVKLTEITFRPGNDYVLHPALDAARNATELYGEAVIPLLKDLPFAHSLEIEGAYRYSHYSDTPDTHTWKAGGTWEPLAGLRLRGVYSHSVRIPNFGELFSPQIVQTVGITSDPCSGTYITQNPNRATNCAAVLPGLTLPLPYPNTNAPTILLGGNRDLTPEKSNSLTLGAVFQPRFLPGFDLTVDYFDIKIDNAITAVPYLSILNLCVDSSSGPDAFYCGLISRNATGQIDVIQASNYNLATLGARGIDFGMNYRFPLAGGQMGLAATATYLLEQKTVATRGTAGIDYAGQWNYPKLKANVMATYSLGDVTLGLNGRFIGRTRFDVTDASHETRNPNRVPAYFNGDVTVQVRATDRTAFTLGVRNVTNVGIFAPLRNTGASPNSSGGVQTGAGYYDPIGRYFFAKIDVSF
jgi:outer membrane receptor protein involved in Fe transport